MKKIAFIMPKLSGGGAERVVSTIIRHINKNEFKCYLILFNTNGDYQESIPKEVNVEELSKRNIIGNSVQLVKIVRKIKPEILFSSMRSISVLLALLKVFFPSTTKLVFRENNTPSVSIKQSRFPWLWRIIYKTIFKYANKIVCQSDFMVNDFRHEFNYTGNNLVKIYNPVDIQMIEKESKKGSSPFPNNNKKNVIAIGKMTEQKGIDLLLKSFANYRERTRDVNLWLLGEGKEQTKYELLAASLGIDDSVHFVGRQNNPFKWMNYADLLILPSRYEGLPNVLLEALCCGCPVVTTDHPGGTNEIMEIIDCPDRIVELNWDKSWFNTLDVKKESFNNHFGLLVVINEYEKLLSEV
ncbi:glycosyltransferase [Lentibacillus salinarum]|uniref:Glycosyltransferase n=1 Tax=Lentibacillus salinarum TaxID=446820 RepID=A0ABW3ZX46_9BACI